MKVGAGIQLAVNESMFVKGEVSATFFDTSTIIYSGDDYWDVTPTAYTAKVGIGFKF